MKVYKINYHSFIDVITNSSSEMFVSTDSKVIEFFRSFIKEKEKGFIRILKFKDFKNEFFDEYTSEQTYKDLKDDDYVLTCKIDSEQIYEDLPDLLTKLNFKNIY